MMNQGFGQHQWQGWRGGNVQEAQGLERAGGFGGHMRGMFGQQTGGGYDSSGINPHGQFGDQPQGQIPQAGYEQGSPFGGFPQRPPNFNPMPMGANFGQSMGQPQSGGYDSSGINPGGMFSQPKMSGPLFGGSQYGQGMFPKFGGMYQGGFGQR